MDKTQSSKTENTPPFFSLINNSVKYRLFLLRKIPAAYFSGLKIVHADIESCSVSVPFKWFTQNPFRSTYFACLGMAAEMSTGLLAMANIYERKPSASMLITGMESSFHKKATGKIVFTCAEGMRIKQTINDTYTSGAPQTTRVHSKGYNAKEELIAEFWFTWSFKLKQ